MGRAYHEAVLRWPRRAGRPLCFPCTEDGVYDRTARHPAAVARVEIPIEPWVIAVWDYHLAQLRRTLPTGGLRVVERYPSGQIDSGDQA